MSVGQDHRSIARAALPGQREHTQTMRWVVAGLAIATAFAALAVIDHEYSTRPSAPAGSPTTVQVPRLPDAVPIARAITGGTLRLTREVAAEPPNQAWPSGRDLRLSARAAAALRRLGVPPATYLHSLLPLVGQQRIALALVLSERALDRLDPWTLGPPAGIVEHPRWTTAPPVSKAAHRARRELAVAGRADAVQLALAASALMDSPRAYGLRGDWALASAALKVNQRIERLITSHGAGLHARILATEAVAYERFRDRGLFLRAADVVGTIAWQQLDLVRRVGTVARRDGSINGMRVTLANEADALRTALLRWELRYSIPRPGGEPHYDARAIAAGPPIRHR